jgi:hypothetical protein
MSTNQNTVLDKSYIRDSTINSLSNGSYTKENLQDYIKYINNIGELGADAVVDSIVNDNSNSQKYILYHNISDSTDTEKQVQLDIGGYNYINPLETTLANNVENVQVSNLGNSSTYSINVEFNLNNGKSETINITESEINYGGDTSYDVTNYN